MRYMLIFALVLGVAALAGSGRDAYAKDTPSLASLEKKAKKLVNEIRGIRDAAEALLRKARDKEAASELDCINENLVALKGVLKLAENYMYSLQSNIKQGRKNVALSDFRKVEIASNKAAGLRDRIQACGGPNDVGISQGEPVVKKTLDADLPTGSPELIESETLFVERPAGLSPY